MTYMLEKMSESTSTGIQSDVYIDVSIEIGEVWGWYLCENCLESMTDYPDS